MFDSDCDDEVSGRDFVCLGVALMLLLVCFFVCLHYINTQHEEEMAKMGFVKEHNEWVKVNK